MFRIEFLVSIPYWFDWKKVDAAEVNTTTVESFHSVPTGKCIQSALAALVTFAPMANGFHSLQTGECIQGEFGEITDEFANKFRFPSSGKVSPKVFRPSTQLRRRWRFRFPSTGKVSPKEELVGTLTLMAIKFRFPSNGKVSPKLSLLLATLLSLSCFHFLQTGKSFRTMALGYAAQIFRNEFRFPSIGKVSPKFMDWFNQGKAFFKFRFPSNGKVSPKEATKDKSEKPKVVSIPFQWESVSKAGKKETKECKRQSSFDSLRSGKCLQRTVISSSGSTSIICFDSLRSGKCLQRTDAAAMIRAINDPEFRFPSIGKVSPKLHCTVIPHDKLEIPEFRFPSIGKVSPKQCTLWGSCDHIQVSIPFARESVSKEVEEQYKAKSEVESFDSLRAGKCLQSTYQHHPWNRGICLFRFPSRGKVSPKKPPN